MKDKKEIVDKYLTQYFKEILEKQKKGTINWALEKDVIDTYFHNSKLPQPIYDKDYVRSRFRKLKNKIGSIKIEDAKRPLIVKGLLKEIEDIKTTPTIPGKFIYLSGKEDKATGKSEFHFSASHIPTEEEIITHFNIDLTKYKISQIWHKTTPSGKYSISVNLQALKGNQTIRLDDKFIEKLSEVKQPIIQSYIGQFNSTKLKACLLIPKQDAHWNKFDVNGANTIEERFQIFTKTILNQLEKAQATNNIEKIIYIVGSDEFNSEYTNATTKGTPQQNILTYQEAFEKVSQFSIEFVKLLRFYSPTVEIVLLNGNHDHNVSWHLANLLKHVFSLNESIIVDTELINTKVVKYSSNLILLNHGDEMKPKDLATKFPIIAKNFWSKYDNYFVITGDKHHEVAHDFNGVKTYQVPQLSTAKSAWDDKRGHICSKAESVMFLFEEDGLSNILRKQIK